VVRALGDGPAPASSVLELRPDEPVREIPAPSFEIRAIHAVGEGAGWRGVGWRALGDRGADLLLLPPGASCVLADPDVRVAEGAAIAVLADGALAIVGGLEESGRASSRVALLAPGAELAARAEQDLAAATAYAAAVGLADGRIAVIGGAIAADAPAYDTFELLDPHAARGTLRAIGSLTEPRREHAAIALGDGRVLVAGGREARGAPPLASLEVVDLHALRSERVASLARGRIAPVLVRDREDRIWIAGGEEEGVETSIERFDLHAGTLERFVIALPTALAIGAAGQRLAWIAAREAFVVVLSEAGPSVHGPIAIPELSEARAIGTAGGRILVVGRIAGSGARLGFLVDPGRLSTETVATSRVPRALARLGDASLVELGDDGASLRRIEEPTPFDDPPSTLLFGEDDAWLVLDPVASRCDAPVRPRWRDEGTELSACVAGARAELRAIRILRGDLVLRASGPVEVRLESDAGAAIPIAIDDDAIAIGSCRAPRASTAAVAISVDADAVRVDAGRGACDRVRSDAERVAIAIVARAEGARVRSVSVARRAP
jgi:hypothetical protein